MKLEIVVFLALTICCFFVDGKTRIVGGGFAGEHEYPHQVALLYKGGFRCGGSVIGSAWILTAAHCVVKGRKILKHLSILAGTNSLTEGGVKRDVVEAIVHKKYSNNLNDIALLRLGKNLVLSSSIRAIDIVTGEIPTGARVIIAGWGKQSIRGPPANRLKANTLRKLSSRGCSSSLGIKYPGLICLGHSRNNGACFGDSGGSAIYDGKLVGVANFIVGTCGSSKPDAYAKVSWYKKWIENNIARYEEQRSLENFQDFITNYGPEKYFSWVEF